MRFRCLCALAGLASLTLIPSALCDDAVLPSPVVARGFQLASNHTDASFQFIPASAPQFLYEGRFDRTDPAGPVVIWQASRVAIDFEGRQLALRFDSLDGQSFFDVQIDDAKYLVPIREKGEQRFVFQPALGNGRHRLKFFKRSEANAGYVRFEGIDVASGAAVWKPAPPHYRLAMEFIGDSITVGACNEDGPEDQWEDRSTHNNANSYGAMTAAAFSADYRNIAVSGMGIVTGYVQIRAEETWDRVYPRPTSARADLSLWRPDVVFVNLGENDDAFSKAKHHPFPPQFTDAYVSLIHAIRQAYPNSWIVLLRGGMSGGAKSLVFREAWNAAVVQLEVADPGIKHFVFTHWTGKHPRVADHKQMANELIAWIKTQHLQQPAPAAAHSPG